MLRKINFYSFLTNKRCIFTTTCVEQGNQKIKQVQMMKKIMVGREKGKRRWVYNEDKLPKVESAKNLSTTKGQIGKEANRRIAVLNKLFMKNVTDLMAYQFSDKLFGYGLQISTVKVDTDFKKMNIYYIATGMDDHIEKILKSIAGPLRHELSVLRLMGEVPQINFVKDRSLMKSNEIDSVLKHADFGEDFVPSDPTLFMRSLVQLEMKIPDELKEKIKELDKLSEEQIEEDEELPPMRNNTFGFDHTRVMSKIIGSLNKSKQAWESFESNSSVDQIKPNDNSFDEVERLRNEAVIRQEFISFLEKKHLQKKITPERKKHSNFIDNNEVSEQFDEYKDPVDDGDFLEEETSKKL